MNIKILNWMKKKKWDMALKVAVKSKVSSDRHTFIMVWNRVGKELRVAKADFLLNIIEKAAGNTNSIWSQLKILMGHKS